MTEEQRARALARYEQHRRTWDSNEALRVLYAAWYARIVAQLPEPKLGPFIEIGSGPGFARSFIPGLQLSDVVPAPWLDREIDADHLPFADRAVGALMMFDVLHHLPSPSRFFAEASRVLAPGGRIVLCEPYISPLSFPFYHWLHDEPVVWGVDPLAEQTFGPPAPSRQADQVEKDPFDSNQAIPTLIFDRARGRAALAAQFPQLRLTHIERLAGPVYAASGGFSRAPLIPFRFWRALYAIERLLPAWVYRLIGFRILVVMEKGPA